MSARYLSELGVLYYHCPSLSDVDKIASERSYKNRDEIVVSPDDMGPLYEEKVHIFFNEHLHEDEEIRYILDGHGYFDIRDGQDEWIRIRVDAEDLLVRPPIARILLAVYFLKSRHICTISTIHVDDIVSWATQTEKSDLPIDTSGGNISPLHYG